MYIPHYGRFRAGGYVGMLPRAEPEAVVTQYKPSPWQTHIHTLLEDALVEEEDMYERYERFLRILEKAPRSPLKTQAKEVLLRILNSEKQHADLLKQTMRKM